MRLDSAWQRALPGGKLLSFLGLRESGGNPIIAHPGSTLGGNRGIPGGNHVTLEQKTYICLQRAYLCWHGALRRCPDEELFDDLICVGEDEPWDGVKVRLIG